MAMMSKDYAVYLPAVNSNYASEVLKPIKPNRPFPKGYDLKDLIFWDKGNKLWHHNHVLHSVGLHNYGKPIVNAITQMGKTDYVLVGDSGGFQIGKGRLNGYKPLHSGMASDKAVDVWRDAFELKRWIVDYLETHCDYAMTIDMPLWVLLEENSQSPFHKCTIDELTALTVSNLKFIDLHRANRTKWLNVIQGFDEQGIKAWWDAVKWFDCSGYALAGNSGKAGGIKSVLTTLLMMHEEGYLQGKDWIHVLGVSTPMWAIFFTAIQKALRKSLKSDIRVSYDSSSPFRDGGEWEKVNTLPTFEARLSTWTFGAEKCKQSKTLVGSDEPFPYPSALGQKLTWGDLNVRGGAWDARKFDTVSNLLLVNHNVWTYLTAFEMANQIAFDGGDGVVPHQWVKVLDLISGIFEVTDWRTVVNKIGELNG